MKNETVVIIELVNNHYEILFDTIMATKDKDKRKIMLDVVLELIQEVAEYLAPNTELFDKVFSIANDPKSDKGMIEIILKFSTSLCDLKIYNRNFHLIFSYMIKNEIV